MKIMVKNKCPKILGYSTFYLCNIKNNKQHKINTTMEITIIKHLNGFQVENITCEVNSKKELEMVKVEILSSLTRKKSEIMKTGLNYQEIEEGSFYGFISDTFQFIQSNGHIDIQEGNEHIQYVFNTSDSKKNCEFESKFELAA